MSDYQRINANFVEIGEDTGEPSLKGALGQTLKVNASLVDEKRNPIISYIEPVSPATLGTINFHNQNILNFSGGGGGSGDASLAGGIDLANPQEFTGFNRFDNDLQLKDHLLFSDDGVVEKGKISATSNEMKIITDTATDIISMKLGNGGSTNTLELKQDPSATTQNGLFLRQDSTSSTLDKVLTNSTQDLGVIVDSVEVSPNVFTASNTFTSTTTTNGVTNIGNISTTNQTTTNEHTVNGLLTANGSFNCRDITVTDGYSINATGVGSFIRAGENIVCGSGHMFFVGPNKLKSTDLDDTLEIVRQLDTSLTISGQITGNSILSNGNITTTTGGNVIVDGLVQSTGTVVSTTSNVEARGGSLFLRSSTAGMVDDVSRDLLIQANSSGNKMWFGLGSGAKKALQLDILGTKARLRLYDYTVGRDQYYDVGQNPDDVTGLIALIQNTSLTFNGTTTTTFDAGSNLLLNGTTTLASGATDIGKTGLSYGVFGKLISLSDRSDTDLNPVRVIPSLVSPLTASAAPYQAPTYVYNRKGTNGSSVPIYEVVINGNVTKSTNWDGNGDQLIFTLPVNFRPSGRITYRAQSRGGRSASRVDITTAGEVLFIDGGGTSTTYTELSLSGMSFYANI